MLVPYKVLLPKKLFKQSSNDKELELAVVEYMKCYPHYHMVRIEGTFAICERKIKEGGNIGRS